MTAALSATEFGRLLRPLLPKDATHLAIAVSGGADSLALALLTAAWAKRRKIAVTAFIVDHGLRKESATEARQVGRWLTDAEIAHRILRWRGAKPAANRQAAAREARYDLLAKACAKAGIRHLLVAQHRDDQAETLLLRSLRGSGVDGLAAMAPQRALSDDLMLLRPLLDVPKARLIATLEKRKQPWVEDPSNASPAYARVRVRRALDLLSDHDAAQRAELVAHLAQTARNFARTKALLDGLADDLLRRMARLHPAGFAWLDPQYLRDAPDEIALRGLARLLGLIGGAPLPPRLDRLERLLGLLRGKAFTAQTLHRCALRTVKGGEAALLVCREARHLPAPLALRAGMDLLWDGRFRVMLDRPLPGVSLAPLGTAALPPDLAATVPPAARASLPALVRRGRLLALPGLTALPGDLKIAFGRIPAPPAGGETGENA
jgi:tRNA(Ile)-lysidine synthase